MPEFIHHPISSLPRTFEAALQGCGVRFPAWAGTVVASPTDWSWLTIAYDQERLWIVALLPADPLDPTLHTQPVSAAWIEAERLPFNAAPRPAQHACLGLLDEIYGAVFTALRHAEPPLRPEQAEAAATFLDLFAARDPVGDWGDL
jgi:hypothetical protein